MFIHVCFSVPNLSNSSQITKCIKDLCCSFEEVSIFLKFLTCHVFRYLLLFPFSKYQVLNKIPNQNILDVKVKK